MVDKTLKSFFAATGAWRKIPLAERASQGAKRSEKNRKSDFVTFSKRKHPRSGQAASNSSPRRRAGSEISFSGRGPPKKGKARS